MDKKKFISYFVIIVVFAALSYYILPLIFETRILRIFLMIIFFPVYQVVTGLVYSAKFGFRLPLPIISGLLFIPSAFLFFGYKMALFSLVYMALSFIGCGIGYTVYHQYHKTS